MKKLSLFLLSTIVLLSCSAEDSPEVVNLAPSQPQLVAPQNDLFCTTDVQTFQWSEATDPEEDKIIYILEISTDREFKDLFFTGETGDLSKTVPLKKGEDFYWRITAKDISGNKSKFSNYRRLYTEAEAISNFLPDAPGVVSPEEATTIKGSKVNLQWEAGDADGDEVNFDLYFGKNNDPALLKENLETSSYEVDLEPNTTYYWKVVVKDEHQGKTTGKIWTFITE